MGKNNRAVHQRPALIPGHILAVVDSHVLIRAYRGGHPRWRFHAHALPFVAVSDLVDVCPAQNAAINASHRVEPTFLECGTHPFSSTSCSTAQAFANSIRSDMSALFSFRVCMPRLTTLSPSRLGTTWPWDFPSWRAQASTYNRFHPSVSTRLPAHSFCLDVSVQTAWNAADASRLRTCCASSTVTLTGLPSSRSAQAAFQADAMRSRPFDTWRTKVLMALSHESPFLYGAACGMADKAN